MTMGTCSSKHALSSMSRSKLDGERPRQQRAGQERGAVAEAVGPSPSHRRRGTARVADLGVGLRHVPVGGDRVEEAVGIAELAVAHAEGRAPGGPGAGTRRRRGRTGCSSPPRSRPRSPAASTWTLSGSSHTAGSSEKPSPPSSWYVASGVGRRLRRARRFGCLRTRDRRSRQRRCRRVRLSARPATVVRYSPVRVRLPRRPSPPLAKSPRIAA